MTFLHVFGHVWDMFPVQKKRFVSGALPFECTWEGCTKTFAKEYMMKYHVKMWHECETRECEVCFKHVKVRVFKRHMLTHTGTLTLN